MRDEKRDVLCKRYASLISGSSAGWVIESGAGGKTPIADKAMISARSTKVITSFILPQI